MPDINQTVVDALKKLKAIPGVEPLLAVIDGSENERALAARTACLEELSRLRAEAAKFDEQISKLRADFETKQQAAIEARGRIGAAEQRRSTVAAKLHEAERALRTQHGEEPALYAERRLVNLLQFMPGQIEGLNAACKQRNDRPPLRPSDVANWRATAERYTAQMDAARHGLSVVREELLGKPIPPAEIAVRAAELLEAAGIND